MIQYHYISLKLYKYLHIINAINFKECTSVWKYNFKKLVLDGHNLSSSFDNILIHLFKKASGTIKIDLSLFPGEQRNSRAELKHHVSIYTLWWLLSSEKWFKADCGSHSIMEFCAACKAHPDIYSISCVGFAACVVFLTITAKSAYAVHFKYWIGIL